MAETPALPTENINETPTLPTENIDELDNEGSAKHRERLCSFVLDYLLIWLGYQVASPQQRAAARLGVQISAEYHGRRINSSQQVRGNGPPGLHRFIYQYEQGPGFLLREENQPPCGDQLADLCFDHMGVVHNFYVNVFGRPGINGAGFPTVAVIRSRVGMPSLSGSLENDMLYYEGAIHLGNGDGWEYLCIPCALDIVAHELTHGFTVRPQGIIYQGDSGALNESISDVFASMIKQWSKGETSAKANWLIGENTIGLRRDKAMRSLKEPGTAYQALGGDQQVRDMRNFVDTPRDHGGVHINSGIANRAFYLIAIGLGGNSWDKPGKIWYRTISS
jgi:Zn-dependent metalloprotease